MFRYTAKGQFQTDQSTLECFFTESASSVTGRAFPSFIILAGGSWGSPCESVPDAEAAPEDDLAGLLLWNLFTILFLHKACGE